MTIMPPQTTLLLGSWHFFYTIIGQFDHYYYLTEIDDDTNSDGYHFVNGVGEYDDPVIAAYYTDHWCLLDPGTIIDRYYVFILTEPTS